MWMMCLVSGNTAYHIKLIPKTLSLLHFILSFTICCIPGVPLNCYVQDFKYEGKKKVQPLFKNH